MARRGVLLDDLLFAVESGNGAVICIAGFVLIQRSLQQMGFRLYYTKSGPRVHPISGLVNLQLLHVLVSSILLLS